MKEDFTDFIEVSGLLDYDPDTISKIYKKNPKRLLKRLWQTLIPIIAFIFSIFNCINMINLPYKKINFFLKKIKVLNI